MKTVFKAGVFILSMAAFVGCDGGDADTGNPSGDTDSHFAGTDGKDTSTTADESTIFTGVDCSEKGNVAANCEYEICAVQDFYTELSLSCDDSADTRCGAEMSCYALHVECMKIACPIGTAVPQTQEARSEAGIYVCKQLLQDCMEVLP